MKGSESYRPFDREIGGFRRKSPVAITSSALRSETRETAHLIDRAARRFAAGRFSGTMAGRGGFIEAIMAGRHGGRSPSICETTIVVRHSHSLSSHRISRRVRRLQPTRRYCARQIAGACRHGATTRAADFTSASKVLAARGHRLRGDGGGIAAGGGSR